MSDEAAPIETREVVTLNVGGKTFQTYKDTLDKFPWFKRYFEMNPGELIDRNPHAFEFVLEFMRTGIVPNEDSCGVFYPYFLAEMEYFGLTVEKEVKDASNVKKIRWREALFEIIKTMLDGPGPNPTSIKFISRKMLPFGLQPLGTVKMYVIGNDLDMDAFREYIKTDDGSRCLKQILYEEFLVFKTVEIAWTHDYFVEFYFGY